MDLRLEELQISEGHTPPEEWELRKKRFKEFEQHNSTPLGIG